MAHGDSFDVSSVGKQCVSTKETLPSFSFGTGSRDVARMKVFLSKAHSKQPACNTSPGPVYDIPSSLESNTYSFGKGEQRPWVKPKYPDSSIDLTGAQPDSQKVKYQNTKGVHFGTESRMNTKNCEIVRVQPETMIGTESPGALEYYPKDELAVPKMPVFSFGSRTDRPVKDVDRVNMPHTSTPRHVGPGSHQIPPGIGQQPVSARSSAPAWTFRGGSTGPKTPRDDGPALVLEPAKDWSSLGRQVVSNTTTAPICGFGKATRDQVARTFLPVTEKDRGPAGAMPRPRFHLEIPPPSRMPLKAPGL